MGIMFLAIGMLIGSLLFHFIKWKYEYAIKDYIFRIMKGNWSIIWPEADFEKNGSKYKILFYGWYGVKLYKNGELIYDKEIKNSIIHYFRIRFLIR